MKQILKNHIISAAIISALGMPIMAEPREVKSSFYIGPVIGQTNIGGDFDGETDLFNPDTNEVAVVPKLNAGLSVGAVLGYRRTLNTDADWGVEMGYQTAKLDTTYMGFPGGESTYQEFDFNGRIFLRPDKRLQPTFLLGLAVMNLKAKDAIYMLNTFHGVRDGTFKGMGVNLGGGLAYFIHPKVSLEALVVLKHRSFDQFDNSKLDGSISANNLDFGLGLKLHI